MTYYTEGEARRAFEDFERSRRDFLEGRWDNIKRDWDIDWDIPESSIPLNKPTVKERMEAYEQFVVEQRKILLGKGHDYTAGKDNEDAYTNFRVIADMLEGAPITAYTICMIYFLKHVFSLITFTKRGKQESGEGLRGRHLDVSDYAFILDQLVPDHLEHFRKEVKEDRRKEWVPEPSYPLPGDDEDYGPSTISK